MIKIASHANLTARYGSMIIGEPYAHTDKFSVWIRLSNAHSNTPEPPVVHAMISNACRTMDLYYPAVMKVIWGGMNADEAIKFAHTADDDDTADPPPPIAGYE